jgi:hypothetical protein
MDLASSRKCGLQGLVGEGSCLKLGPTTQSSNRSPLERGTEIFDAETNSQTGPSATETPPAETHAGAKSPHSSAINAKRLMKVSTRGLGGGDSRARTDDPALSHQTSLRISEERKFSMQRRELKIGHFPLRRRMWRLSKVGKSPHSAGIMRGHQPGFEPWRLGGGRTRARTWDPMIKSPSHS